MTGLVCGLAAGFGIELAGDGLALGLAVGLASGLGFGLAVGLEGVPSDLTEAANPRIVLTRDRQMTLFLVLAAGLAAGLAFGLAFGLGVGLVVGLGVGLVVGLVAGLVVGLALVMSKTMWVPYMLARTWLAMRGRLPWSLMSFLEDAHQRGVLRQTGAVYQFRHIELQHRLASRYVDEPQANSPAAAATEADG